MFGFQFWLFSKNVGRADALLPPPGALGPTLTTLSHLSIELKEF
jgi:hypothetical protein